VRRALVIAVVGLLGWLAAAAPQAVPPSEMAPPPAGSWGASWEPAPRPTGPAVKGLRWFQTLVDAAAPNTVLRVPPGRYSGPVVMTKSLVIEGGGEVTIDNGGTGTVFVLETSGATLRGLTFTGSGDSHSTDDTCLNVRGNHNTIEDDVIDDCLFGIDLKQSNENLVARNHIRSKAVPLGVRGDAIRLWYSMKNRIEENTVTDARDVVIWYSNGNHIARNEGRRGRYSLHFMFAQQNVVEDNKFYDNSVGIYVMYTTGVIIRNNLISHSSGPTGMGIGFKEASDSVVDGNSVIYCGIGISSDLSPDEPDSTISIRGNRLAYNGVGLSFVGDKSGTIIEGNIFEGNIDPVVQSGGGSAMRNTWRGNYWDNYEGFDRNRDGIGDTPFELYAFTDQIWMETPSARFFKDAPLMEAIDFLERLAPFSAPTLLVRDEAPMFSRPQQEQP
jgi:nitrous oxidase accessory protein